MKFNVRVLKENDYDDILVGWWEDWKWIPPVKDFLPLNGVGGIMVEWDGTPVCAGFIYNTNSKVAWIDWIVSNNNFREKPHRKDGLNLLIQTLTDVARKTKYKYVYAHNNNTNLINTFLANGYLKGSKSTELIKNL